MRILVDMDGVTADFERAVIDIYRAKHPDKQYVPFEKRKNFYVKSDYPKELQPLVDEIYLGKGFFRNLQPIPGSIEALHEMEKYYDVRLCTSPLLGNPYCTNEKLAWVHEHLGREWQKRTIIAPDKTLVRGDILIDDRPQVDGADTPAWEHIIYDQPYNRHVTGRRRITWNHWRSVLEPDT